MRDRISPLIPAKAGTQRAPAGAPAKDSFARRWRLDPGLRRDERYRSVSRFLIAALSVFLISLAARAEERITNFDVAIEVRKDGDLLVTETIDVFSEGFQIQRGIFRDLPRTFLKEGRTLPYDYDVKSVTRDGDKEPYAVEEDGNAWRIRIGDADVYLEDGPHTYVLTYEVKNEVRYFDNYDEVYWNATGNYWAFPIDAARARVTLPGGAAAIQHAVYTGGEGATGAKADYRVANGAHVFTATAPLAAGEGMTVAVGFAKGVVDPPSAADARAEWWTVNASRVVLGAAFLFIAAYYFFAWRRIGRDPAKGPVFARYDPPQGYSPAAVHYVYRRGLWEHDALIATLMNLAVRKRIEIDVDDKTNKTVLTRRAVTGGEGLSPIDVNLETRLLPGDGAFSFGEKFNSTLTSAYEDFRKALTKTYGAPYFKWNRGFLAVAFALTGVAVFIAVNLALDWTPFHTACVAGLVIMALAGSYFLPAPTPKGQDIRTEIEGLRLYLKTAEELQLNAVEVGSDAPPPMTVARYERFLPYAIALGVEKPWTEHFEKLMPAEAAAYRPHWAGSTSGGRSLTGLNAALVANLSSGVTSSLPQSSSSSGSGGGGSSGGGGGGGGGGGW